MSDPIKMGCNHNEPKTTEPVPNQSNKTPVSHSHQLINPPVVRSNDDSHQQFEHKSQPQRSRHSLPQQRHKRSTYDPPPRVPVDTFIFHRRGPRVIRNQGGCNDNNSIVVSTKASSSGSFRNHDDYQENTTIPKSR